MEGKIILSLSYFKLISYFFLENSYSDLVWSFLSIYYSEDSFFNYGMHYLALLISEIISICFWLYIVAFLVYSRIYLSLSLSAANMSRLYFNSFTLITKSTLSTTISISYKALNYWFNWAIFILNYFINLLPLLIFSVSCPILLTRVYFFSPEDLSIIDFYYIYLLNTSNCAFIGNIFWTYSPNFSISANAFIFLRLSSSYILSKYSKAFLFYLTILIYSLYWSQKPYIIFVYLFVSNNSSKIFFRLAESENGQRDSSWWQNTMFYKIGLVIPNIWGICFSISAHWWLISIS